MKTTIRSLALLLSVAFLLSACVKTKDDETKGSFTHAGKTYTTNKAMYTSHLNSNGQFSYGELSIASSDFTNSNFSGKVSAVGILFDQPAPTNGTFTYRYESDPNFQANQHFFDAYMAANIQYPDINSGTFTDYITSGTVTVTVSGERVTVNFDLDFDGEKVTGSYTGPIKTLTEEY